MSRLRSTLSLDERFGVVLGLCVVKDDFSD
jgi:hypothetical protein